MKQPGQNDTPDSVIDQNLRRVYEETLEEGVPDRFKDLLEQLREQERNESGKK